MIKKIGIRDILKKHKGIVWKTKRRHHLKIKQAKKKDKYMFMSVFPNEEIMERAFTTIQENEA